MPTDGPDLTCAPSLICAAATPLRADFTVDRDLLREHARNLLARGCDGLAVFGTSGEGPCLPLAERRSSLGSLLAAGLAPERLVLGASSAGLADVAELTRHALSVGVQTVLLMPPFFLRAAASEEGVFRFYAEVIERAADPRLRLLLYNFPAISGVLLPVGLIRRLRDAFGDVVHGIKDSGGDFAQTQAYLEAFPELTIYTGTEVHARRVVALGGTGTICGLGNVLPQAMRRYLDAPDEDEAARFEALIKAVDDAICVWPFLPACKTVIARSIRIEDWRRVLPPLAPLDDESFGRLGVALDDIAERHGMPVG
jgi:4-hydroxy-tetrahydrodipicolinate synthase